MNIQGFQKLTMLDFPGRTACTVFTGGCNLRCPFCHNAPLVTPATGGAIAPEEIFSFLETRRGKLDGVAVTGGEPLLQKDLADFLQRVRDMGFLIKLDTNGFFPDALASLLERGLVDYVAMDVKNSREKYAATCGRETLDLSPAERTIGLLKRGNADYEFRTTVMKEFHTPDDIEAIAKWIAGAPRYYLQQFKDSGILDEGACSAHPEEVLFEMRDRAAKYIPEVGVRGI